jgi:hypothetical protein
MTEPTEPKASAKQGHTHRHGIKPYTASYTALYRDTSPFSSTTTGQPVEVDPPLQRAAADHGRRRVATPVQA